MNQFLWDIRFTLMSFLEAVSMFFHDLFMVVRNVYDELDVLFTGMYNEFDELLFDTYFSIKNIWKGKS